MDYFEIGQRIRRVRKARGLSQEQLAEKVGISITHMSHIETANTKLSLPVLVSIAEELEVQTDMLLYDQLPQTTTTYANEVMEILDRCDAKQVRIIVDILKTVKQSLDTYL